MRVLRWGQSAYETDADMARERADAEALGLSWELWPDVSVIPDLSGVDALVTTSQARVRGEALARFEGRLVLTTTSGVDHLDVAGLLAKGVLVGRCPLARRDAVVEQSLGALIGLMRQHPAQWQASATGQWARGELPALAPRGLAGAKVAVVGLGVIGSRMAELLVGLGAEVLGVDVRETGAVPRQVGLREALLRADALTLHCALGASSAGLVGEAELALLQRHAVVVNTARGGVLDVRAAVLAVKLGRLRGLAVDVFPVEPWPELLSAAGWPNLWFTPHAAGFVHDLGARVAREVQASLAAWVAGEALPHGVGPGGAG